MPVTEFHHKFDIGGKFRLKQAEGFVMVRITDVRYSKRLQKVTYSAEFASKVLQKIYGGFVDIAEENLS